MFIKKNKKLSDVSYYKTGGVVSELFYPESIQDVQDIYRKAQKENKKIIILGGTTNSLILDESFSEIIISTEKLNKISLIEENTFFIEAGLENTEIANLCLKQKLTGGEFLYCLPGQLGGTVRMNARCYGGEISQIVKEVTSVDLDGNIIIWDEPKKIFKGYKDTLFMQNQHFIYSVKLNFKQSDPKLIETRMKENERDRISKGHFDFPSCGCVFKNDYCVGVSSGFILEKAGAKELFEGDAIVNPKHANFVFNRGRARARDILNLTFKMRNLVFEKYGIWLEYEMELIGELSETLKKKFYEKRETRINEIAFQSVREEWKFTRQIN